MFTLQRHGGLLACWWSLEPFSSLLGIILGALCIPQWVPTRSFLHTCVMHCCAWSVSGRFPRVSQIGMVESRASPVQRLVVFLQLLVEDAAGRGAACRRHGATEGAASSCSSPGLDACSPYRTVRATRECATEVGDDTVITAGAMRCIIIIIGFGPWGETTEGGT